jgi:hypothetical protein
MTGGAEVVAVLVGVGGVQRGHIAGFDLLRPSSDPGGSPNGRRDTS